jgi:large subunit ribosomal protein L13Ae
LLARVLRLQPGHKYCLLGELSKEVGWNYHETIKVRCVASIALLVIYINTVLVLCSD